MRVFNPSGADMRQQLLTAVARGQKIICQKVGGQDVDYFSPEAGFVLLEKTASYSPESKLIGRVAAVAELSLGTPLELREFYYTLRQTPKLIKEFEDIKADGIYTAVLKYINYLEIICDVYRETFCIGNLPKGFFFYGHSPTYGNPQKLIGFTENLMRNVLTEYDLRHISGIIHLEKNAAATRLVNLEFSKLTNMAIETTGGNFTRAVDCMVEKFQGKLPLIFFCDADAFGVDMLRTVRFGSESARHLPNKFSDVILAGLYPSIGEELGVPNDVGEKRPLQNEHVRRRIDFLQRYNLVDKRDYDSWMRDYTCELEGLSTTFKNTKGEPIGLALYLIELFRLKGITLKPQPERKDADEFVDTLRNEVERAVRNAIDDDFIYEITSMVEDALRDRINEIVEEIMSKYEDKIAEIGDVSFDTLRKHALAQYQRNPKRASYSISEIARKLIKRCEVEIEADIDELRRELEDRLPDVIENIELRNAELELDELDDIPEPENFYDTLIRYLKANPDDAEKIREAIERRFA